MGRLVINRRFPVEVKRGEEGEEGDEEALLKDDGGESDKGL
jgi:hypothetical protein